MFEAVFVGYITIVKISLLKLRDLTLRGEGFDETFSQKRMCSEELAFTSADDRPEKD
jgi:hypothetical protein